MGHRGLDISTWMWTKAQVGSCPWKVARRTKSSLSSIGRLSRSSSSHSKKGSSSSDGEAVLSGASILWQHKNLCGPIAAFVYTHIRLEVHHGQIRAPMA